MDSGYLLTTEERAIHFKVYAGPGAGKTHFLANNIKNIIEDDHIIKSSDKRKVLCITYTNAAANELKARLSKNSNRVVISTIHSFISEYIIRPYQPMLKRIISEQYNIDIRAKTLLHSQIEGRGLLFGHHREDLYSYINSCLPEPDEIKYSRIVIDSVALSIDDNKIKSHSSIKANHVKPIKTFLWDTVGVLSHDEVLIFGLALAKRFPLILYALRVEFPFVFIDEFQDTNPVQTKLVQLICSKASVAGVIGDAAQSIYSFQNAKPEDFIEFSVPSDSTRGLIEFILKINRRSKDNIVKILNYIRQKDHSLSHQITLKSNGDLGQVIFFVENVHPKKSSELPPQIQEYIDSGAYVLTRTWAQTFQYIRGIDRVQSKLVNELNNLYTYQLHRDFRKTVAEFRDIPWVRALIQITTMEDAYTRKCIPTALQAFKGILEPKLILSNPALLKKFLAHWYKLVESLKENESLVHNFLVVNRFLATDSQFWGNAKIIESSELLPEEPSDVDSKIYDFLCNLQYKTGRTLVNEVFSDESRYMTVHQAKGREFEKVLVYLEPARPDGNVSYIKSLTHPDTISSEYDRIMYVAMSRAISQLGIHIKTTDDFSIVTSSIDIWCHNNNINRKIYEVVYV